MGPFLIWFKSVYGPRDHRAGYSVYVRAWVRRQLTLVRAYVVWPEPFPSSPPALGVNGKSQVSLANGPDLLGGIHVHEVILLQDWLTVRGRGLGWDYHHRADVF